MPLILSPQHVKKRPFFKGTINDDSLSNGTCHQNLLNISGEDLDRTPANNKSTKLKILCTQVIGSSVIQGDVLKRLLIEHFSHERKVDLPETLKAHEEEVKEEGKEEYDGLHSGRIYLKY